MAGCCMPAQAPAETRQTVIVLAQMWWDITSRHIVQFASCNTSAVESMAALTPPFVGTVGMQSHVIEVGLC